MISLFNNELRPCVFGPNNTKGLCHGVFQQSDIYAPSLMVGGHQGGVIAEPVAVIEIEGGQTMLVNINSVRFLDNKFKEYCFNTEGDKND